MDQTEKDEKPIEPPRWVHYATYAFGAFIVGLYIFMAYNIANDLIKGRNEKPRTNNLEAVTNQFQK